MRRFFESLSIAAIGTGAFMVNPWLLLILAGVAGLVVAYVTDEGTAR